MTLFHLPNLLRPLLAAPVAHTPTRAPSPERAALRELVVPDASTMHRMRPVLAGALLLLDVAAVDALAHKHIDVNAWGSYRTDQVVAGQWWRVFTYSFAEQRPAVAASDAVAIVVCGTALTHMQSPALAFAAFRLGMFAPLLAVLASEPRDRAVANLSGPAYSMLGAALVSAMQQRGHVAEHQLDTAASVAIASAVLPLVWRLLPASSLQRRAALTALAGGAVAASIAHVVQHIEAARTPPTSFP